jgi:hypothetical protein
LHTTGGACTRQEEKAIGQSLGDALDTGSSRCAIGGLLALVGAAFRSGCAGRSVDRTEYAEEGYVDDRR